MKRKSSGFTMVDLMVGLVILFVACTLTLQAATLIPESAKRVQCAQNLRLIGQAILLYSNDAKGPYPRCKYDRSPGVVDKPTCYTAVDAKNPFAKDTAQVDDVTAAMFLLIRTKHITPDKFVCPSTDQTPLLFAKDKTALDYSNFPDNSVLSYSYANPYPNTDGLGSGFRMVQGLEPSFVVAGDMNPGGDDLTKLKATRAPEELRKGNSKNHAQDGQNLLYGDGHVDFVKTPFAGTDQDNVYTYGKSGKDSGGTGVVGPPDHAGDSVLLPTADDGKPAKK